MSTYHSIKVRMVTASGGSAWRNIIGTNSSSKKLQIVNLTANNFITLLKAFLAVQTEEPYIGNDGKMQVQIETYTRYSVEMPSSNRVIGVDNWDQVTDERLLVNLIQSGEAASSRIEKAATGTAEGDSLAAAVTTFSEAIADAVEIVEVANGAFEPISSGSSSAQWVSSHITGTMDTLVAEAV